MRYLNSRLCALVAIGFSLLAVPGLIAQDAPAAIRGDVDGDGRVTRADAEAVRAYLVRGTVPAGRSILPAGDANGDGRVTAADAALITRFAAGADVSRFPVGKPVETDGKTLPGNDGGRVSMDFECTVDVAAGVASCREPGAPEGGAQLNVILGGSFVSLTYSATTSSRGNPADEDTTTTSISLKNNIGQPIGTLDGTNPAPDGTRLFFSTGPTVTAVNSGTIAGSTVRVDNPDGTATFGTFIDKPFFQYNGVLATNATYPSPEVVRFAFSSNVKTFSFFLRVSAPVQYEHGWITVAPATVPVLGPGQTTTLTGTVYDVTGAVQGDAITWSSSNEAVATVNASTGEVTGVSEGTATITATSTVNAQRTGTRAVTVDVAPSVSSTSPTNGATAVDPATDIDITFDESVSVTAASFALECPVASAHAFALSGSGASYTLTPTTPLPGVTTCTVTVVAANVSDSDANDGPDNMAADYVFSFTTAAVAKPDTLGVVVPGNISVNDTSFSVLDNDAADEGVTVTSAGWLGTPDVTENGGTVAMESDGTFTYDPPAGFDGMDHFTYTLSSGSSAEVTVTVAPPAVWFVKADTTCASNCGRLSSPFPTLAAFNAANTGTGNNPGENVSVFLYENATKFTGPVTLLAGQKLIGQDATASLATLAGLTLPASAASLPVMNAGNGVKVVIQGPAGVNLATNNTLRGLTLEAGTSGQAISGSNFGTLTLGVGAEADVSIASTGQALSLTTGTIVGTFVSVGSAGGTNNVLLSGVTGDIDFGTGTFSGSTGGAILIAGGPLTLDVAGSVSTVNGPLLDVSGSHTGTLTFTGTSNLQATGASSGLQFNAAGGTYAFNGTTNLAGTDAGVDITNGSGGTFTFGANTTITNPSGVAFNLYGSTAGVTYSGGITKSSAGNAIEIGEHSGGTVTFQTGTITIGGGTGIQFSNADGTYNFNGTTTLNGGDAGIDIINGSGGTFAFNAGTSVGGTTSPTGTAFNVNGSTPNVTFNGNLTKSGTSTGLLVDITNQASGTITFQTGTLSSTSSNGTGIQLSNADGTVNFNGTTTLNAGDAGIDIISGSGGTFAFSAGTSVGGTTSPTGTAFTVNGSTPNVTFNGNLTKSGTSTGLLVDITNQASGTITFQTGTLSSTSSNGTGIQLSNADGTVNFNGTNTLSNGNNGVDVIGGSTGTVVFSANTSISNPSGTAFLVSNSSPSLTYPGTINANSSRAVEVSNTPSAAACGTATFSGNLAGSGASASGILVDRCNAGTLTFSGASKSFSTQGNGAVTITNNGATVNFTNGGLAITTTSGAGFSASGGGTVTVETGGTNNTVSSTAGGTAVNINGTSIGGNGVTFYSVNATGSGSNGIVLANTGAGAFEVTGDGASNAANTSRGRTTSKSGGGTVVLGSGGTISGRSGTGVSLTNTGAVTLRNMVVANGSTDAVNASGVTSLTLDNDSITGHANGHGIRGNSLGGLTLTHSSVRSNATAAGVESTDTWNVRLTEVTGTATVQNSKIALSRETVFGVINNSGSLNLNITNTNITDTDAAAPGANGLQINAYGSSIINATLSNDSIARTRARGITMSNETGGSGSMTLNVSNTKFADNFVGLEIAHGSGGTATYNFDGNEFQRHGSIPINVNRAGSPTFSAFGNFVGTIQNNTIGTPGVVNSGTSTSSDGIHVESNGAGGNTRVAIVNNTIRQVGQHGIYLAVVDTKIGGATQPAVEARVQGNNVGEIKSTGLDGLRVVPGAVSGDHGRVCLDVTNNTLAGAASPAVAYGWRIRTSSLLAPQVNPTPTIQLKGWNGSDPFATYAASRPNTLSGGAGTAIESRAAGTVVAVASCTTP